MAPRHQLQELQLCRLPERATSERLTSPRRFPHPIGKPSLAMLAMTAAAPAAAASAARPTLRARRAAPVARGGAIVRASAISSAEVSRRDALVGSAGAASIALFANPGAARAIDVGVTAPGFTLPATGGRAPVYHLAPNRPLGSLSCVHENQN